MSIACICISWGSGSSFLGIKNLIELCFMVYALWKQALPPSSARHMREQKLIRTAMDRVTARGLVDLSYAIPSYGV